MSTSATFCVDMDITITYPSLSVCFHVDVVLQGIIQENLKIHSRVTSASFCVDMVNLLKITIHPYFSASVLIWSYKLSFKKKN